MTYEEFLVEAADQHAEWVGGEVVPRSPVSDLHSQVTTFLITVLNYYVSTRRLGRIYQEPFNMRLPSQPRGRSPDLLFLRADHLDRLRETYLDGPADLVIEVVSPGSGQVDRGEKYYEYEAAGIPEYWLLDPHRKVAEFYRLSSDGVYQAASTEDGVYRSSVIDGLWLRVDWLWQRPPVGDVLRELTTQE
jgi:Uma2 family endonuclease